MNKNGVCKDCKSGKRFLVIGYAILDDAFRIRELFTPRTDVNPSPLTPKALKLLRQRAVRQLKKWVKIQNVPERSKHFWLKNWSVKALHMEKK